MSRNSRSGLGATLAATALPGLSAAPHLEDRAQPAKCIAVATGRQPSDWVKKGMRGGTDVGGAGRQGQANDAEPVRGNGRGRDGAG